MHRIDLRLRRQALKRIVLVVDAMGVLYESADDVAELLVPFVSEHGGVADRGAIEREYLEASLGRISAATFWRNVGVSPALEDQYLARHRLADDLPVFLQDLPEVIGSLWCLSNDVSEWSRKLRTQHGLTKRFTGFVISGDVGIESPVPGFINPCWHAQARALANVFLLMTGPGIRKQPTPLDFRPFCSTAVPGREYLNTRPCSPSLTSHVIS